MKRIAVTPDLSLFPETYHRLLQQPVYDSSCSADARVYCIDSDGVLFLKTASKGTLQTEATMNRYFHALHLGPEVLDYRSEDRDWLLTRRIPGEDCTHHLYLSDPKRLCDTTATLLRQLHELNYTDCPVVDRNENYLFRAEKGFRSGYFDSALFPDAWRFPTKEECWQEVQKTGQYLTPNALLHGDYCLPNILLDNWTFSGFVDLGGSGVGDRHFDIFWGVWTLFFNLKTNAFYDRFLDAYGRDRIEPELLRTIAAIESFL